MDVFALGLMVFAMANRMISFWECACVSPSDGNAVLKFASTLTDEVVDRVLKKTFPDEKFRSLRSWLADALRVDPLARMPAERLKSSHSLFGLAAPTINIGDLAMKGDLEAAKKGIIENANANAARILTSIDTLSVVVKQGFDGLGNTLDSIKSQACMGNKECRLAVEGLHTVLLEQKKTGQLQVDALNRSMSSLGTNFSAELQALQASMSKVGEASSSQGETDKKLDLLLSLVKEMRSDIDSMGRSVELVANLALESTGGAFPSTFTMKPKAKAASSSAPPPGSSSGLAKITGYLKRKIRDPVVSLLWNESKLVFVCPVTCREVECGPSGDGYDISVPTPALKTLVPALRFGLLVLKIGLATQGLGASVPSAEGLLPAMAGDYLNALTEMVASNIDGKFESVDEYLAAVVDFEAASEAMRFVEPFLRKAEGVSMENKDWVIDAGLCGLNRLVSKKDKTVAWVSDDAMPKFNKEGKAAFAAQLKS